MSDPGKAIFLSYASQDAEAVARIAEALRAAGVEVWFDKNELVGGDAWDAKIRGQIASCALFVPVISAATQARLEGYFRIEWKLAAQRTHAMAEEKAFLLPVVIDDTRDAEAKVPAEFKAVQWTLLREGYGEADVEKFCARVKKLIGGSELEPGRPSPAQRDEGVASPLAETAKLDRRVPVPVWIAVAALIAAGALYVALRPAQNVGAAVPPSAGGNATAPVTVQTEAQKLVAQARKIYDEGDELDRENLLLAEDLVKRALALDAAEPAAWLLAAQLSHWLVWHSSDNSQERRAEMLRQAARARALAPDSVAAQVAHANARVVVAYANFQSASNRQDLADLERELLALAARAPRDYQVQRSLSQTYRFLQRPDEALRSLRLALELSGGDPTVSADTVNLLLRRKNYAEAETMVASSLARRPSGRLLVFDLLLKNQWRGDLAGARAALATWPGWLLREDRGAFIAWQTWLWSGQPDRALDVVQRLPRDYLRDVWFTGPRAALTARAHEMAGHQEAAQSDWRTVVRLADRELAAAPTDVAALFWKTWALSRLGDQPSAEAAATLLQQHMASQTIFFNCTNLSLLWSTLGRTELAVAHLRAGFGADNDAYAVTRAMLELDPAYEALRKDPQFAALVAEALAPQPERSATAAGPKPTDEKSVAVLAFANLSDDKTNEYFSDGISEELLNVLAKVPGLKVSARTSAFSFKGKNTAIPDIAKQLGVAYVVEGSVRKAGDKVRITAQLIKAADGFQVWSDTFTRDLKDIFAVQDEIAGLIAGQLQTKLGVGAHRKVIDSEAYALVLQARHAARRMSNEGWREAVEIYRRAIKLDARDAQAWAELADCYVYLGRFGGLPTAEGMREARAAARTALELDPEQPIALAAFGMVQRTADQDWRGAQASFRRALALAPGDVNVMSDAAICFFNVGLADEGIALVRRAAESDPLNPRAHWAQGIILAFAGRFAESLPPFRRAIELAPGAVEYRMQMVRALVALGRFDEAEAVIPGEPHEGFRLLGRAFIATGRGDAQAAAKFTGQFIADYGPVMPGFLGSLHALGGNKDEAFLWLIRAYETRDQGIAWAKTSVYLKNLHDDPRWPGFLRRMGLADDQLK